ncbi:acid protease [Cylindrobasidium torrendii FP15055 ss-10]|uniref:Acid protease n=1 Tax=Cylindrobasidium torrendii FP15055 ss-10 TaxID=1314674 RepID=A0A0D7B000_9AGAR|nr:acid protease [Cylindrobasidium torrendii FP15055 ss-10]
MKFSTAVVFAAAAFSVVVAPPPPSKPAPKFPMVRLAKRFELPGDGKTKLPDLDRARAAVHLGLDLHLGIKRDGKTSSTLATNAATIYTASVGVGSPATEYNLIIDTGSANTWIGAGQPYQQTSTSRDTGETVQVAYGSGFFSGEEYIDQVTIADNLVIDKQSIGVADKSAGIYNADGILGIGPAILTTGSTPSHREIPTVTDNLAASGAISNNAVGIFFAPTTEADTTGVLTWGGADPAYYTSKPRYVPVTRTRPASAYWGIDQSIMYHNQTLMPLSAGIVDTGSTLLLLATDIFKAYKSATGGQEDAATGLLKITNEQYAGLSNLDFVIGDNTFSLTPNAQIWPRYLNTALGGDANAIYLIAADMGAPSGRGMDFINGYTFLERFYTIYDTTNSRVGFAETEYTYSEAN